MTVTSSRRRDGDHRAALPAMDRHSDAAAVIILVVVAFVTAFTFRDYGLGWDDFTHSQYGDLLLSFYASGFRDRRVFEFVNLYEYGGGFDMAAALAARVLPFGLFETRRLVGAVVGILGMVAVWRIGRRIGGPFSGVIALALIATCPLYFGHMANNAKDAPFAVAMTLLLLACVRCFDEYPRPGFATIVLFGIGLGLTIGSRVIGFMSALFALPAFALIVAVEARRDGAGEALKRGVRFVLMLLPGLMLAYGVMALVWPWGVLAPLNPLRAVGYFSQFFEKPWKELFAGALIPVTEMPRSYLPTLLALKLPELMLVLGFGGAIGAAIAAMRGTVDRRRRAVLAMLALAVLLPIAITVAMRPAMYNGIRHFLFVLPPLAALGGAAAVWVAQALRGPFVLGVATAVLLIGLSLPVIGMLRVHPYEYTQFNTLAGGVRAAHGRYMLDYWGLSFKQASQALLTELARRGERAPHGSWRIAVCGPHPPARVALGPGFDLTWDPRGADFAMMLGEFYCAKLDAPMLAEITRAGVSYARVYDIRGRAISDILTMPPP